jgi:serine phosphatase RsbU (regulator of sigma subunit)
LLTTAFYLVADWATGVLQYANAGHPKPFHLRRSAGQVVPLANAFGHSQPPLGFLGDTVYFSSEALLSPGDGLLLFTDGLVDVENPQGQLFTQEMLVSAIQAALSLHPSALLDELLEKTRRFGADQPYQDDVCLVAVDYHGCA